MARPCASVSPHSDIIQESLFPQPVLCAAMDRRSDVHESVNFEVENGFCPGLDTSHAHDMRFLDVLC